MGIPFVVRSVEPVLAKLDGSYEEAGAVLGANNFTIFRRIILPEILPAGLAGFAWLLTEGLVSTVALSISPGTVLKRRRKSCPM